jgi:hypothetical protein
MSYYYSVIKDSPIGLWRLDETSGSVVYDSSGCENNGTYVGSIIKSSFPMTSGGQHSVKITSSNYIDIDVNKDLYGLSNNIGLISNGTEDNDFSFEAWFHPKTLTSETKIFAEINDVAGIYYDNGNIIFKLTDNEIYYTVPDPNRSLHVVGTYTVNSINLFLNGELVATKNVSIGSFNNTNLLAVSCGPASGSEYFIADSLAIYRYALNQEKILNHYLDSLPGSEVDIVNPDGGELFKITDRHQNITEKYIYPVQKSWEYFLNDDLLYRQKTKSIYLNPLSESGSFEETISIVYWKDFISSRIEWSATKGVSVFVSTDSISWTECENGKQLPGFSVENFSENKIVYIKVEFNSNNSEVYIPELYYLGIDFYTEKKIFAHNSPARLSTDTLWDINFGSVDNSVLHRYQNNGVNTDSSGFYVETEIDVKNVEFILDPTSITNGYLIYNKNNDNEFSIQIGSAGQITKTNISNIYVNGNDISSETNISSHIYLNEPNYILIKSSGTMSGQIWLNAKVDGAIKSGILGNNLYNNIALYAKETIDHYMHYQMYIGKYTVSASDSSIELTEKTIKTYSRDRILLNNL